MTTLRIDRLAESDPAVLYVQYPGQHQPQPCHLALDLEEGTLTADYNPEIGNAIPASVFHHRILWATIPTLTAAAANAFMDEISDDAQQVLDGATIEWNGNNRVGGLTAEADAAWERICALANPQSAYPEGAPWADADLVSAWDADDWFSGGSVEEAIDELGLTADSTDADLEAMAEKARQEAATVSDVNGYVVLHGAVEWLTDRREEMRQEAREALQDLGEQIADLTAERSRQVARLASWGDSDRSIGRLLGKSHTWVANIREVAAANEHLARLTDRYRALGAARHYDMAAEGTTPLALPIDLDEQLRAAWNSDIVAEVNDAINALLREHGVTEEDEWLGDWSAADVVRRILRDAGVSV